MHKNGSMRLQSAMEYLMTYGWAILIIAVVLGALFQLGVFNPASFAPKAQPGACQVIRPYGIGNTNYISLAGTCNGQLPQYVALVPPNANISITQSTYLQPSTFTVAVWYYESSLPPVYTRIGVHDASYTQGYDLLTPQTVDGGMVVGDGTETYASFSSSRSRTGVWHFEVGTYGSANVLVYLDGSVVAGPTAKASVTYSSLTGNLLQNLATSGPKSMISNIQIYNASLTANDITALYNEGIGGAPIDLFHLIGWWPLNGNANDYSGNQNNGVSTGISYSTSWASTYTAP